MEPVVLACADPSARTRSAVDWARNEARRRGLPVCVTTESPRTPYGAKMIVCGRPREAPSTGRATGSWPLASASAAAAAAAAACPPDVLRPWREKYPEVPVLEDVVLLTPVQALLHHSAGAALVVVGTTPGTRWGETAEGLLRDASCPVAVVPGRPTTR